MRIVEQGQPAPVDAGRALDLADEWVNTNPNAQGLVRVTLAPTAEQSWSLRGTPAGTLPPWPAITFTPQVAAHGQVGFHAELRQPGLRVQLIANYKLGVLVILSCTSFEDGSGRAGYTLREFFRRAQPRPFAARPARLPLVDLSVLAGRWMHTTEDTGFVRAFEIRDDSPGWSLALRLGDGRELAPVSLRCYRDNMGYLAFKAQLGVADGSLVFAANTQTELIVLTTFHRTATPGADNRAYRQIFCRVPADR